MLERLEEAGRVLSWPALESQGRNDQRAARWPEPDSPWFLMAGVAWILGSDAIVSVWTLAIAIVASIALVRFRVNPTWLALGAAGVGLINAATGFI
jgi:hypothetical protein